MKRTSRPRIAVALLLSSSLAGPTRAWPSNILDVLPANRANQPLGSAEGLPKPTDRNLSQATIRDLMAREAASPGPFQMVTRTQWGARPAKTAEMELMGDVDGVVIHHTVNSEEPVGCKPGQPDRFNRMNNLQYGHMHDMHYADIGYHYVIAKGCDQHWHIFEGRDTHYKGAHAGSKPLIKDGKVVMKDGKPARVNLNDGKIGIAFSGNFEDPNPALPAKSQGGPPAEALQQLAILMAKIKSDVGHPIEVYGHGGVRPDLAIATGHTACPGDQMMNALAATREVFGGRKS